MAETKELILSLKIAGTAQQTAELKKLQTNLVLLRKRNAEINAQIKKGIPLSSGQRKAFRNLSTQIKATSTRVGQLNKQILINNGVMKKTVGLTKGVAAGFRTVALQFVGVMAAFALVKNIIGIFKDFQQANADLAAVLGKSRSEIVALTNDAKKLGATTAFTASEVAKLQKEFAKLGFSEREILAATKATLDLAAATNTDLAEAARVAGATVRGFGLDASETQRVVDVMAKSFSSSALDMDKFSTAMGKIAPVAKAVGLTIEETTGFMGTLADSGIEASIIGTSLRRIFIELSKKGLTLTEALDQITNSQDKLNTANKIFGARAATAGLVLAANADKAAILTEKLNAAGGTAKRMAEEQLDTLTGSTIKLSSAWEGFILGLEDGEGAFAGAIRGAIDLATSILRLGSATKESTKEYTKVEKATNNFNDTLQDEKIHLKDVFEILKDENTSKQFKRTLTEQLNTVYGEYLTNLIDENSSLSDIEKAQSEINNNLRERIALQLGQAEVVEIVKEFREEEEKLQAILRDAGLSEAQIKTFQKGAESLEELSEAYKDITVDFVEVNGELISVSDAVNKLTSLQNDQKKAVRDVIKVYKDLIPEINTFNDTIDDADDKKGKDKIKSVEDIAKKELQLQIKLIADLDKLEIKAIKDSRERRERELLFEFENRLNSIKGNGEIENQLRTALREQLNTDIAALDEEFRLEDEERKLEDKGKKKEEQLKQDVLDADSAKIKTDLTLKAAQGVADAIFAISNKNRQRIFNEELKSIRTQFDEESKLLQDKFDNGIISQQEFDDSKATLATEAEKREEDFRRKAFNSQKRADLLQVGINTALAITKAFAMFGPPPSPVGISSAIAAGIAGATQAAVIAFKKFEKGGIIETQLARGGLLRGKSHARGGIPTADGQMEFEGGEAVINKRSTAMFGAQLSAINQAGGGVAFGMGGRTPIHKFQAGSITPVPAFTGRSITGQAGLDIDTMAEKLGAEIAGQIGELRVINVVSDTTDQQLSIENTESEASFG